MKTFPLLPFPGEAIGSLRIEGGLHRRPDALLLSLHLTGSAAELAGIAGLSSPPADNPERRDGLWQTTCFELFWGRTDAQGYWELNCAPSGHWNVYAFDSYRQGMRREEGITKICRQSACLPHRYSLELELPIANLACDHSTVRIGLSTILDHGGGILSHWAFRHPESRPDFHAALAFGPLLAP